MRSKGPGTKRRLPDFITSYQQYVTNSESPEAFHLWASISVVSATLERRAWMEWGHTTIYPNQYVCLIGPSGVRKGEPVTVGLSFLKHVGVATVSEQITLQALIRRMKDAAKHFDSAKGIGIQCAMTGVFEELAVFLGENNIPLLAALTNWYDSRDSWTYETKGSGQDEIVGVCFNILGSMADDWVPIVIPATAIGGGFTSRIIFIVEYEKSKIVEDPSEFPIDKKLLEDLHHDLECIYQLEGSFYMTKEALIAYKSWYGESERLAQQGKFAIPDVRFSGYNSRRATHIKKLSMACSASRGNDMQITIQDFRRALLLMTDAEKNMASVFGKVGKSPYTEAMQLVINYLQRHKRARKSEVLKAFFRDIDAQTLNIIEENLSVMKMIKVERDVEHHESVYIWDVKEVKNAPDFFKIPPTET